MPTKHVALVTETAELGIEELHRVSSALSIQVTRDFGPIWGIDASVDPFVNASQVPPGYWIVSIQASDAPGDAGFHTSQDNQPSAFVRYGDDWPLRASHETLEMLADPFGNSLQASVAVDDPAKTVEYLVEVCDPCETEQYDINGVAVAEFYTPHYFDAFASPASRYSFKGGITQPRQVLPGGYLSWRDPSAGQWFQLQFFDDQPAIVPMDPGVFDGRSLRECIDTAMMKRRRRGA